MQFYATEKKKDVKNAKKQLFPQIVTQKIPTGFYFQWGLLLFANRDFFEVVSVYCRSGCFAIYYPFFDFLLEL